MSTVSIRRATGNPKGKACLYIGGGSGAIPPERAPRWSMRILRWRFDWLWRRQVDGSILPCALWRLRG